MSTERRINGLFVKRQKGCPPEETGTLDLSEKEGAAGDCHSGDGDRQVCLIFESDLTQAKKLLGTAPCVRKFSCNAVISGDRPETLKKDAVLCLGSVRLLVTAVGRDCHGLCSLGSCPLTNGVIFARVIGGGTIKTGEEVLI